MYRYYTICCKWEKLIPEIFKTYLNVRFRCNIFHTWGHLCENISMIIVNLTISIRRSNWVRCTVKNIHFYNHLLLGRYIKLQSHLQQTYKVTTWIITLGVICVFFIRMHSIHSSSYIRNSQLFWAIDPFSKMNWYFRLP